MPISVTCSGCSKSLKIKDEYIGKRIKCPTCGATFTATKPIAPQKESSSRLPSGIHLSPGTMVFLAFLILIPGSLAIWNFGPGKTRAAWAKLEPKAKSDITDVIDRGLQGYLSNTGEYDASMAHAVPHAIDLTFPFSPMGFSLPEQIGFAGTTTQGMMTGKYNTKTGEIEADVEIGGIALPGAGVQRHGNKKIAITGRMKDGNVVAEVNGKPASVNWGDPSRKPRL